MTFVSVRWWSECDAGTFSSVSGGSRFQSQTPVVGVGPSSSAPGAAPAASRQSPGDSQPKQGPRLSDIN